VVCVRVGGGGSRRRHVFSFSGSFFGSEDFPGSPGGDYRSVVVAVAGLAGWFTMAGSLRAHGWIR
jgi:hypothetical protein